jgi:hypothetical protein
LIELFTGKFAIHGNSEFMILDKIVQEEVPIPEQCSEVSLLIYKI